PPPAPTHTYTLSLHDALPISQRGHRRARRGPAVAASMIRARIRVTPEDFEVEELMGFEPDGQGEHLLLWIEKRGINTAWLGTQLDRKSTRLNSSHVKISYAVF